MEGFARAQGGSDRTSGGWVGGTGKHGGWKHPFGVSAASAESWLCLLTALGAARPAVYASVSLSAEWGDVILSTWWY